MPSFVVYSLIAAFFFAVSAIFNKIASRHYITNPRSLMAYFMLGFFLFGLFLFPFASKSVPGVISSINSFVPMVITFLAGYYLFFMALSKVDISTFSPIFQLQAVFVAILAYFFLGERYPVLSYLWMIIVIIGVILVTLDERISIKSFIQKSVLLMVVMQILHSISNIYVKITLSRVNYLDVMFWESLFIGLLFFPFVLIFKPRMNYGVKAILLLFISSSLANAGAIFLFRAFQYNVTISGTLGLMLSPIAFLITLAISKFKPEFLEKHSTRVYFIRSVGLILATIGAISLSFR